MTPKHFAALAAITAVVLALSIGVHASNNRWASPTAGGKPLLPGFTADRAAQAKRIELRQGEKKITLEFKGDKWGIAERAGFPVKGEPLRALMVQLAKAELVDGKTRVKDRHALLELEDPAGKEAKSRGIRLLDVKGQPIADVVVGKKKAEAFGPGKAGSYVRRTGEDQTWLASNEIEAPVTVAAWVDRSVFSTDAGKIKAVTLEVPGEAALRLERDAGGKFKMAEMPAGRKLKQNANLDQIAQGYAAFELEDVRKATELAAGEAVEVAKVEIEAGLMVTFRLRKDKDDRWLSVTASGEGDAKRAAEIVNGKTGGWEFKLPGWKADAMFKKRADLLEAAS